MEIILSVKNLTKKIKHIAVNNLSFDVKRGSIYGILGPNSSGKSTVLGMLLSTIPSTSGECIWFGEHPTTPETLKRIGSVIEQPNFYPFLNAEKNLKIIADSRKITYENIDEILSIVGLSNKKDNAFRSYTVEQKRRLSIAAGLLNSPEVLVLDEPTYGLDNNSIEQIRKIIATISQKGITIIIASQALEEIEKICTDVVILKEGSAIYTGSVNALTNSSQYQELKNGQNSQIVETMEELNLFKSIQIENEHLLAYLQDEISGSDVNFKRVNKGIYFAQLNRNKISLENQFLEFSRRR